MNNDNIYCKDNDRLIYTTIQTYDGNGRVFLFGVPICPDYPNPIFFNFFNF